MVSVSAGEMLQATDDNPSSILQVPRLTVTTTGPGVGVMVGVLLGGTGVLVGVRLGGTGVLVGVRLGGTGVLVSVLVGVLLGAAVPEGVGETVTVEEAVGVGVVATKGTFTPE